MNIKLFLLLFLLSTALAGCGGCSNSPPRILWLVEGSPELIYDYSGSSGDFLYFLNLRYFKNIRSIILYTPSYFFQDENYRNKLPRFNSTAHSAGINVYPLAGDRKYLCDGWGHQLLIDVINKVIEYNAEVDESERFDNLFYTNIRFYEAINQGGKKSEGFCGRLEFYPGRSSLGLSPDQADEREYLLTDYLTLLSECRSKLAKEGIRLGGVLPAWTDDYYGAPVTLDWDGVDQELYKHILDLLDEVVLLAYWVDPDKVIEISRSELDYSGQVSGTAIYIGLDTHCYSSSSAEQEEGQSFAVEGMNEDDLEEVISIIDDYCSSSQAFMGISIYDYNGYLALTSGKPCQ
ncbi:MAG: hypothetical protein AB1797_04975 [bacterium]